MSRIKEAFKNGKAFIPFMTCGDPDMETTYKCVLEAVKAGADLIVGACCLSIADLNTGRRIIQHHPDYVT